MDIAALSMNLSQMKVAQQASISVLKIAMERSKVQVLDLTQLIEISTKEIEEIREEMLN